jgi:hypothetical protein
MTDNSWLAVDNDPIHERLGKIRTSLQKLSISEEPDAASLKKELAIIVKQLDDVLQSIKTDAFSIKQHEQKATLERDMERELGRVRQPIKPDRPRMIHIALTRNQTQFLEIGAIKFATIFFDEVDDCVGYFMIEVAYPESFSFFCR